MAGFRIGRGRGSRGAQQQGQYGGPQGSGRGAPGSGPGGPGPGPGAYGQRPPQQWPHGGRGEPEYFGDQHGAHPQQGRGGGPQFGPGPYAAGPGQGAQARGGGPAGDPYANSAGHTRSFTVPDPYGPAGGHGPDDGYGPGGTYGDYDYSRPAPPPGPRLHWKELLSGVLLRPSATFWQMRDHSVWAPAIIVTFLYGLLAIFGLDQAREEVIHATLSSAIPYVLSTGIAVVLVGLILGAVTHTLARQFGGDGAWAPTVGLSMLIMSLTDAPRLLVALFLGGTAPIVQVLGWVTWVAAGALFTMMVSRSHDIRWPRALGASAVQLVALLVLIKLGTL
ncbi:Yip1 family protein [Streptomyces marispadix]|uniref:YIP1 family protein n=1 Tax=Streptomyces marispadix TaxID=2922868 RepID=A0ABS9SYC2_9ACTN|nr:Yip1 family protein [Streptomyces marispadix]MCH6161270.1 YIP1 family protein [Streptomyces marispadix]